MMSPPRAQQRMQAPPHMCCLMGASRSYGRGDPQSTAVADVADELAEPQPCACVAPSCLDAGSAPPFSHRQICGIAATYAQQELEEYQVAVLDKVGGRKNLRGWRGSA